MADERESYQPGVELLFRGAKSIFLPGHGAILYDEYVEGSPIYSLAHGNSRVERTYVCRWHEREAFARAMLGYPKLRNNIPFGLGGLVGAQARALAQYRAPNDVYVSRVIPHALTDFTDPTGGESYLYAQSISRIEGKGTKGTYDIHGVPEYYFAVVTVVYEAVTFKIVEDQELDRTGLLRKPERERYITKLRKPGAEYLQLPRGIYTWFDASITDSTQRPRFDAAATRLLPSMELIYVWHQVPFLPNALFQNYVGCVNRDTLIDQSPNAPAGLDNQRVYPPGTLLLLSAEVKPYRTAVGAFVHDITYRLKYYEPEPGRGHNFFFRYKNSTKRLYFTKLTDTGKNDEVPVTLTGIPAIDNLSGAPYPAGNANVPFPQPAGNANPLYPYKPFMDLFALNTTPRALLAPVP